jgi:Putative beta-barrel porin-2, OmpL-like. bbp2
MMIYTMSTICRSFRAAALRTIFVTCCIVIACTVQDAQSAQIQTISVQDTTKPAVSTPVLALPTLAAPTFTVSGYVDAYYGWDNDTSPAPAGAPANARKYSYLGYVRNEFNLNTAQITGSVTSDDYRMFVTLAFGGLRQSAYEPFSAFNTLQQAFGGFRIVDKLWLDGGLFMTHIGGESLLPRDNWFTLYSFATTNEPFYQAGARLSYEGSLIQAQLHLLNGYGIFEDNNDDKSIGWVLGVTPSSQFSARLSGIYGNEQVRGAPRAMRLYNDLVLSYQPSELLQFLVELDYAVEEIPALRTNGAYLASFAAVRYAVIPAKLFVNGRFELVQNANGTNADVPIIIGDALRGIGYSAALEYRPFSNSYIRAEVRALQFENRYRIFTDAGGAPTNSRLEALLSWGIWL